MFNLPKTIRHCIQTSRLDHLLFSLELRSQNNRCHFGSSNDFEPNFYKKCYEVLELPDGSDQEAVRRSFIRLCKLHHPDSKSSTADSEKFNKIEESYRHLQKKFADERWNINEGVGEYGLYYKEKETEETSVKNFDIKHTAPQHRQYLSFEGAGSGTPSQRESYYQKRRVVVANENVYNHRINKFYEEASNGNSLVNKDKRESKKIKTRYGMERLVEDLIQESMSRGEFDNLSGSGKPLKPSTYNPYVDFVTHKMNEIMIDNGFVPEWITLQKEIKDDNDSIINLLKAERKKFRQIPLSYSEETRWFSFLESMEEKVKALNQKINKFNLVVPVLNKQMLYFNLAKESQLILEKSEYRTDNEEIVSRKEKETPDILKMFLDIFQR